MSQFLLGTALAVSATSAAAEDFRIAITDVEGMERLQTEWGGFKSAMEEATGHTFEFFPVNNRTAAVEALRAERVDFVVTGPAEYVIFNEMTEARPLIGLSRPDYFCAIVVLADSEFVRPSDLSGEKVALDDVGSTSGHLCPAQLFADYSVDPTQDIEPTHTTRAVAHEALKRGDVSAIGVNYTSWTNGQRDTDETTPPGAFRVIARSGDLPNDLLLVGTHVDSGLVDEMRTAMLDSKDAIIEGIVSSGGENEKYTGMELVAVEDETYARVREMFATIGQDQFAGVASE